MARRTDRRNRPRTLARIVAKRAYRVVNVVWMPTNPLPLFRRAVRLYQRVTTKEFSDADPFELVEVDPRAVTQVSNRAKGWNAWLGEVVGGDWDQRSTPIGEVPIVDIIADHVQSGEPLDCDAYRAYYAGEFRRLDSFAARCEHLTNLVWDIGQAGYRSQRELLEREGIYALQGVNNDSLHPLLNEIRVDIDRNGGFHHWRCGLHRLVIAQSLGIERVPVLVGTRHADWQTVRDEFRRASSVDDLPEAVREYVGHPDLRGLIATPAVDTNPEQPRLPSPLPARFPYSRHENPGAEADRETESSWERSLLQPGRSRPQ